MKNLKQNYKPLILSSLLVLAVVFAPLTGLAKNGGKSDKSDDDKEYRQSVKVEQRLNAKLEKKNSSNSIWNRFARYFWGEEVEAESGDMPVISGITAPTVLKVGQIGTWKVKASDPEDGSLSYAVVWGDESSSASSARAMQSLFVQESTFTHAYAKAGKYTVKFTVSNEEGFKTNSSVTVHVVGSTNSQAPVISNLSANSKKPTKATIMWKTDVRASTMVWFDTVSPVDTSGAPDKSRSAKILNHIVNLKDLTPGTKYYVVVGSKNGGGTTKSSEISFTTPSKKKAPVITGLNGPTTALVDEVITVEVNATDPQNSPLSYSVDWGDTIAIMALENKQGSFVQTATFDHAYAQAGEYTATFTVQNEAGLKDSETLKIKVSVPKDTTVPVIQAHANIVAEATSTAGAVVTYTAPIAEDDVDLDESATCLPASGATFPMGVTTVLCNNTDSAGNAAVQTSFTVTVSDTTDPIISAVVLSALTDTGINIAWTTNEASTSKIYYSTSTPVDVNTAPAVSNATLLTLHSLNITGLTASTLYHYIIESTDASGNASVTSEATFTTNAGS